MFETIDIQRKVSFVRRHINCFFPVKCKIAGNNL